MYAKFTQECNDNRLKIVCNISRLERLFLSLSLCYYHVLCVDEDIYAKNLDIILLCPIFFKAFLLCFALFCFFI